MPFSFSTRLTRRILVLIARLAFKTPHAWPRQRKAIAVPLFPLLPSRVLSTLARLIDDKPSQQAVLPTCPRHDHSGSPLRILKSLGSLPRFPFSSFFLIRTHKRRSTVYVTGDSPVCPRCRFTYSLAHRGASRARRSESYYGSWSC